MKFVTFTYNDRTSWGLVDGKNVADLGALMGGTLKAAIRDGLASAAAQAAKAPRVALADIAYAPVIPDPEKIFCVGLNYENHRKETGRNEVANPTIFTRFANSQIGADAPIIRPKVSINLDFEGELALVIGKPGRAIAKESAFDHVAGYACYNDGSVRDWQYHTTQFTPGKNFAGTGAFGPYLVTPDEVGPLADLVLATRLNGQVVQQTRLGDMIFDIPTIIAYCSAFTTLEVGDVIVTGTPGGVGAKRTPPLWMKPGDVVEVEIDRVGLLRNPIIDEG